MKNEFCDHHKDEHGIECRRCGSWTDGSRPPTCPPYITRVEPDGSRLPHIKSFEQNHHAWMTWSDEEYFEHPKPHTLND